VNAIALAAALAGAAPTTAQVKADYAKCAADLVRSFNTNLDGFTLANRGEQTAGGKLVVLSREIAVKADRCFDRVQIERNDWLMHIHHVSSGNGD
jgi:hypothetical protein